MTIKSCTLITNVNQNNTGMYTEEISQQNFNIPNNNLDVKYESAYQNHKNEILQTRKESKISHNLYDGKVSKCNNSDAQDAFQPITGLFSCAAISASGKIF